LFLVYTTIIPIRLVRLANSLIGRGGPGRDVNHTNGTGVSGFAIVGPAGALVRLVMLGSLARLPLDLQGWRAIWRDYSHARKSDVTTSGPPGPVIHLARLVTQNSLA
jgi:hypothetical protein